MKRLNSLISLAVGLALTQFRAAPEGGATAEKETKVKFCDKEYDLDSGEVFFAFGNGTKLVFDSNKVSPEIMKQLALHGASQKIGDSFAGVKGNYGEGIQNAQDVIDQLYAGEWKAGRDDSARPRLAELAAAIARIKQVDLEKATAAVEKATDEQRKAWRSNPQVKHAIQQMRLEKAAKELEASGEAGKKLEVEVA